MSAVKPRPAIADLVRYRPNLSAPKAGRIIRLSVNEGALGPSPAAVKAMEGVADGLHRYPDVASSGLIEAIAERHGLDPTRIVVGCGSDELIATLCQAYVDPGDEVIHTQYGFLLFPMATRVAGGIPVSAPDDGYTVSVDAILERVTERTRMVFLANPNNPTGSYIPESEVVRLHAGLPERVLLVLDSAYAEYVQTNDYSDGSQLVEAHDNVVMLRTFSKLYGMAGLRLGWGYFPPEVADVIHSIKPPFGVNASAVAAGIAAVRDVAFQERSREHNRIWSAWTRARFEELGLETLPSVTNFMMVRFPVEEGRNADAAHAYLSERGILVREMRAYGAPRYLRVSIGTGEEMRILLDTIAAFLGKEPVSGAPVEGLEALEEAGAA